MEALRQWLYLQAKAARTCAQMDQTIPGDRFHRGMAEAFEITAMRVARMCEQSPIQSATSDENNSPRRSREEWPQGTVGKEII